MHCDRQELQLYLHAGGDAAPAGYRAGWNVRYTTELTPEVEFYLRGEEYSAQIWHWINAIKIGDLTGENALSSAAVTDQTLEMFVAAAADERVHRHTAEPRTRSLLSRMGVRNAA